MPAPIGLSASFLHAQAGEGRALDAAARARGEAADPAKVRKAARDLEAAFLFQLFSELRKTVPEVGTEGSSNERDMYHEMFDRAAAEQAARRGGVGLADLIAGQLARRGEGGAKDPTPLSGRDAAFLPLEAAGRTPRSDSKR